MRRGLVFWCTCTVAIKLVYAVPSFLLFSGARKTFAIDGAIETFAIEGAFVLESVSIEYCFVESCWFRVGCMIATLSGIEKRSV